MYLESKVIKILCDSRFPEGLAPLVPFPTGLFETYIIYSVAIVGMHQTTHNVSRLQDRGACVFLFFDEFIGVVLRQWV